MKSLPFRLFCSAVCAAALAAGCSSEVTEKPAAPAAAGKKVDAATAGTIAGQVTFTGVVPPADVLKMTTDRKCLPDGTAPPTSDALLVAADKSVQNTFVYIKDGLDSSYSFDPPDKPALLDQKNCMYTPRIFGVRVGQPVEIVNSDPTLHNIHALPMVNREFNHGEPKQFGRLTETFTAPEVMVRFKCDVHAWMSAYAGVVAHPFFAVTDAAGAFRIAGLPPGTYTVEAWHEKLGTKTMQVVVAPSQSQTASFTFDTIAR